MPPLLLFLGALAAAALALGAHKLRTHVLHRRQDELEETIRDRTHELEQAVAWTKTAMEQAETLRAATEALSSSLELREVLQIILAELRKVVDYDSASVQELEGRTLRVIAGVGFADLDAVLGLTFDVDDEATPARAIMHERQPRVLATTEAYPQFRSGPNAAEPIRSWVGVPLVRGDRVIGMITLDKRGPGAYAQEDARLAAAFAAQAAVSIENARLFETARRNADRAETLRAATEALSSSLELHEVLNLILSELRKVVEYDSASVQVLEGRTLRIIAGLGFDDLDAIIGMTFGADDPTMPSWAVIQERRAVVLATTEAYPENFRSGPNAARPILSWIGVPLVRGERLIGMLTLDKRTPAPYRPEDAELALAFASQAAVSIENARLLAGEKQAHERADEASRAKSAFVASMSHELRTPLNAILGFVQLMQRRAGRDAEDREHLEIISRSGEHLLGLINRVLSLARIESGRLVLRPSVFDLAELVRSVSDMFRARAEVKRLRFDVAAADLPRAVRGDDVRLREILINLLGNAFKFTEAGRVGLRAEWDRGVARFDVEDTGPGMSADELAGLFTAFAQGKSGAQAQEGTGLGLALSREFARLMGGDIRVDSTPQRGTRFRVEIRLEAASPEELSRLASDSRRVRALAAGQRRPRLLVVDDNAEGRRVLSSILAAVGFETREAADGLAAVAAWRREPVDLVFMDVAMPVMDGLEATRTIRAEEARAGRPRVPIVAVTASALEHEREAVMGAGCDEFVPKPYREADIFALLGRRLGVRYDYDEPASPQPVEAALDRERLTALDPAWRASFARAIAEGDTEEAGRLAETLAAADAGLAAALRARLKAYRLDELEEWLGG